MTNKTKESTNLVARHPEATAVLGNSSSQGTSERTLGAQHSLDEFSANL